MRERIAKFVINRRMTIPILFLVLTSFFLYRGLNVPIRTYFTDLIPNHPYSDLAKNFKIFGGSNRILVILAVKEGDIFNTKNLSQIIEISDSLKYIPGIDRNKVYSIGVSKTKNFKVSAWGMDFPMLMYPAPPKTPEGIKELKHNIFRNSLYYGRMVSLDCKAALIIAEFSPQKLDYDVIYTALNEIKSKNSDENTTIYIEGDSYLYGVIEHYLDETAVIFGITILLMAFLAFWFTRLARLVFVPLLSMFFCAIWGFGCANLLGFNMDPLILVIPLLLSARALSHSIQFGWRVNEEFLKHRDVKVACEETISKLLYPGLVGIITDGIGILLIAFIPVPLMMKVGIVFFIWAMSVVFVVLIFNPIVYSYLPRLTKVDDWSRKQGERFLQRFLGDRISNLSRGRNAWTLIGAGVLVAVVAGYIVVENLKIGDTQPGTPLLKEDSPYNRDVKIINSFFPGLVDPIMIVVDGKRSEGIISPELMQQMADMQFELMMIPEVRGTLSIVDLVQNLNMKLHEDDPKFYFVPDTSAGVFARIFMLTGGGAEAGDFDQYYDEMYTATNVVAYLSDHTGPTVGKVLDDCKRIIAKMKRKGQEFEFKLAMGRVGVVAAVNESVAQNEQMITLLVFASTFLFCALFFQSWTAGIILILPLGLANLFCFAYMALAGIGLNLQTLPVSSIAVGVGVDYGVYVLSRIWDEFKEVGDLEEAIHNCVATTGVAVTVTGLIIVVGVIFWNFSTIKFQADMGLFLSIVTFFHIAGTLLLIPALVRVIKPRFIMKSYMGKEVRKEERGEIEI